jgi:hypothetical protein
VKIEITCDLKSPVINPPSPSLVDGGFITGDYKITCDLGSRNSTYFVFNLQMIPEQGAQPRICVLWTTGL